MGEVYRLGEIFALDESRDCEAKGLQNSQNPAKAILDKYAEEYINAFLNASGGIVYFGIEDDGRICGVHLDRNRRDELRKGIDQIVMRFFPSVDPELYSIDFSLVLENEVPSDLYVIALKISKGAAKLYWTGSQRVWLRRDGSNSPMPPDMIERRLLGRALDVSLKPNQLPADLTDFVGRSRIASEVMNFVTNGSWVLLVGMGGSGKSSLAIHIARQLQSKFADGTLFLDMRGSSDRPASPTEALRTILRGLTQPENLSLEDSELVGKYQSALQGRKLLIILDDAKDGAQIKQLLPAEQQCSVIVTSRNTFSLSVS